MTLWFLASYQCIMPYNDIRFVSNYYNWFQNRWYLPWCHLLTKGFGDRVNIRNEITATTVNLLSEL